MPRRLVLPGLFTLVSLTILLALGIWQWQRRAEKLSLIATIAERSTKAPEPLTYSAPWGAYAPSNDNYRPVTVTGRFDHSKEAHIFFSLGTPVGGVGGPGYLIVTPFVMQDGGTVLVNRGFVPQNRKDAATRKLGNSDGVQTLTGMIRQAEKTYTFAGKDDPAKNVFFVRDPVLLAAALGLGPVAPFLIDMTGPRPEGGLPQPGVTQIDIPNNHLQYALTWWSLALVLLVIFLIYARRQDR